MELPSAEAVALCAAMGSGCRLMAERSPEHSRGREADGKKISPNKTRAGVWAVVAMAVFFAVGGLGISAFILAMAAAGKKAAPALNDPPANNAGPAPSLPGRENADTGVDHPEPVPTSGRSISPLPVAISDSEEEERTRREVLVRIDLMPSLTNDEKDKLYVQVERAEGFRKIATIPFAEHSTTARATQTDALIKILHDPGVGQLLSDPTVLLFVVGYADQRGDPAKNLEISRDRAESVVKALKRKTDIANVVHAVGMGGQDLFDRTDAKKNCVVEVWAAQPF
jgi:outer membrane protein OmpA-like peptidoglycan-associated protein